MFFLLCRLHGAQPTQCIKSEGFVAVNKPTGIHIALMWMFCTHKNITNKWVRQAKQQKKGCFCEAAVTENKRCCLGNVKVLAFSFVSC